MMTVEASDCARIYREQHHEDETITLKQVISEYVEKNNGSKSSIERILSDNPEQWRVG